MRLTSKSGTGNRETGTGNRQAAFAPTSPRLRQATAAKQATLSRRACPARAWSKNLDSPCRPPTPTALENEIVARLVEAVREADVIVAMDQVPEPGSGVLTRRVKAELAALAARYPEKVFMADSRTSVGDFRHVRIKVNRSELAHHFALEPNAGGSGDVAALARRWAAQIGRDVFVTLGEDGIVAASKDEVAVWPGVPVEPPIDVCGAGDAVLASLAMALGAGATIAEAAEMGNLAGAIVVKKVGTTGTATVAELAALGAVLPAPPKDRER